MGRADDCHEMAIMARHFVEMSQRLDLLEMAN
jgi:hypothetical protein